MTINNKIERVIEKRPSRVHIFFTVDKDTIEERLGFSITDEQLEDIDKVDEACYDTKDWVEDNEFTY